MTSDPAPTLAIHPVTRAEVLAALAYYDELDRELGSALSDALRELIVQAYRRILEAPAAWPPYLFGTRRYLLRRFPTHSCSTPSRRRWCSPWRTPSDDPATGRSAAAHERRRPRSGRSR